MGYLLRNAGFSWLFVAYKQYLTERERKSHSEYAIVLTAYNLRRAISILGVKAMLKALKDNYFNFLVRRCCVERPYTGFKCGALQLVA